MWPKGNRLSELNIEHILTPRYTSPILHQTQTTKFITFVFIYFLISLFLWVFFPFIPPHLFIKAYLSVFIYAFLIIRELSKCVIGSVFHPSIDGYQSAETHREERWLNIKLEIQTEFNPCNISELKAYLYIYICLVHLLAYYLRIESFILAVQALHKTNTGYSTTLQPGL